VLTIDGDIHAGVLTALDAEGARLTVDGKPMVVAMSDLQEIQFMPKLPDAMERKNQAVVLSTRDDLLAAGVVTLAEGKLTARARLAGELALDVRQVDSIILADIRKDARTVLEQAGKAAAADSAGAGGDCLVLRTDSGDYAAVRGVLKSISTDKIAFNYDGQDRTVDTAKAALICLASVGAKPKAPKGWLTDGDGTRLAFDAVTLADGKLRVQGDGAIETALAQSCVAAIRFKNENVTYLSDLTPAAVKEAGYLAKVFTFRRDRSTLNEPMTLGGRAFNKGLGLHSRCELTYALEGKYKRFVALAGIDDAARPLGDATLSILADGKQLLKATPLTGKDKPVPVRLDLTGAQALTILVDFGEDYDVGDHVDLADAKLIR
jgi:hypothetical protein